MVQKIKAVGIHKKIFKKFLWGEGSSLAVF